MMYPPLSVQAGSEMSQTTLSYLVFAVRVVLRMISWRRCYCFDESSPQRALGCTCRVWDTSYEIEFGFLRQTCHALCAHRQNVHAKSLWLPNSLPNTVVANAKMKKELQEIENRILFLLSNSKGNILDDHELIETLASSKKTSTEITHKVNGL